MTDTPIALVPGGSRGLGRSSALHLADAGVDVLLTYHHNAKAAEEVVEEITGSGRRAVALQLDTTDTAAFPEFVETVRRTLKETFERDTFDFLVNNAGTGLQKPFAEITEEEFDEQVAVHLKGVFFLTQQLLPLIADGGRILMTSTGLARFTLPGYSAYAAVKAATEVLARSLAVELGAPLSLVHPRLGRLFAVAAWSMHVGIRVVMGIKFKYNVSGVSYLAYFPVGPQLPR